jgi:uncharacterized protein YcaQ
MQPVMNLTMEEARYVSLVAQRLEAVERPTRRQPTKAEIFDTIQALGCVQLDTISVVARSHETVLWSRLGPYDTNLIRELHFPDKALIEYWAHAAAITPTSMFPYFRRAMHRRHHDNPANAESWGARNRELLDAVLARIEQEGPLASREFERPEGPRPDPWTWYGGKPAKQALDTLWTAGELAVQERIGFQRVYELTDRLLPGLRDQPLPSLEEERRFFVSTALRAMGIAQRRWVTDYFRRYEPHVPTLETMLVLEALAEDGLAIPVTVDDIDEPFWLHPGVVPALDAFRAGQAKPKRTTLLSPFDSLVWNRHRALTLFDFEYTIECYTPAPKRRYGYYSLPILHQGNLVGRLDPVYKRREQRLIVNSIHLEPRVRPTKSLARSLLRSLRSYTDFLGGGVIELPAAGDERLLAALAMENGAVSRLMSGEALPT